MVIYPRDILLLALMKGNRMLTPYKIEVNFRIQELLEEEQLKIIRFVNHLASVNSETRKRYLDEIEDMGGLPELDNF